MDKGKIMTLTDNNGNEVDYELLDLIEYDNNIYSVFYPTVPNDTEVLILKIEDIPGTDEAKYIVETDDNRVQEIYKIFKEKYDGRILFPTSNE